MLLYVMALCPLRAHAQRRSQRPAARLHARALRSQHAFTLVKPNMASNSAAVLRLYRSMLSSAGKFQDYNMRAYARRRIAEGFREQRSVDLQSAKGQAAVAEALAANEMIKRQALIYNMYSARPMLLTDAACASK